MDRFADAVFVLAIGTTAWWAWIAVMMLVVVWHKSTMKYPVAQVWAFTLFFWMLWVIVR